MDYKEDIIRSRTGCVGSSDGAMLERIAREGMVPASYNRRLAVIQGLAEPTEFKTKAMEYGDLVETTIFQMLHLQCEEYVSNPRWESDTYIRYNVRLISHPDIVRFDGVHRTLHIYEVKSTKFGVGETLKKYEAQLYIHYALGLEQVSQREGDWRVKVHLVHYSTAGDPVDFDENRITIKDVAFDSPAFDIDKAMGILSDRLKNFTYDEPEEVSAEYLPQIVQSELTQLTVLMDEIKKREDKIAEFKEALYGYLCENNIKCIKNDTITITRVDPTTSRTFDSKAWLKDYEKEDPEGAKQLKAQYSKEVKRSGYALIKVR